MLRTVLSAYDLITRMNSCNPGWRDDDYLHFRDNETEVQRGEINPFKVTQLVNGRTGFQMQAVWKQSPYI